MASNRRPKLDRNSGKSLVGDTSKSSEVQEPIQAEETPDWRAEMRQEIRDAISEVMNQRPLDLPPGEREIDEDDIVSDEESVADIVKRIEAGNRSNKTAIRLAAITKEGNKQHFLDLVEIREQVEIAEAALKGSIVEGIHILILMSRKWVMP